MPKTLRWLEGLLQESFESIVSLMGSETPNHCPECGGTGWKAIEKEGERFVTRCSCFQKTRIDRYWSRAGVPARYESCRLENFKAINERLQISKAVAQRFVEEFPVVDFGLLFMGPCGSGKTHLAVSVLRELITRKEAEGLFFDFRDLLKKIQNSYNPVSKSTESQILEPVLDCQVLVLDDLGAERPTDWVKDTIAHIINSRYNRKLTTLITTNFDDRPKETKILSDGTRISADEGSLEDRIGIRLHSRLYEMCKVIRVEGPGDFRILGKQEHYRF